jgi:hypothetical protein
MCSYHETPKKKFDFETGYLVKSPCRACDHRPEFPECIQDCRTLDRIQRRLAFGVATTCGFSDLEPYAVMLDDRQKK